jgi:hypothetical protein
MVSNTYSIYKYIKYGWAQIPPAKTKVDRGHILVTRNKKYE